MRFTIQREEFLKGLNIASRAIASKVAVALLANFKFELNNKGLFITGSNYDLTIRTCVPYRINDKEIIRNFAEGSILINARFITDIARKLENEEITFDVVDETVATISSGSSLYRLNCIRAEEYADLDLEATGTKLSLTKNEFSLIVYQTAFAASSKEQRPILTALNIEAKDGVLTTTATDSLRMARKQIKIDNGISFVANIPAKMMVEIDHLLEGIEMVDIAVSEQKALFTIGTTVVATRLIAGDYPNTKNIVPTITNYALQVNGSDFVKAIDRVNILSVERQNIVDLSMNEDEVEISSKSSQVGSANEKVDLVKYKGQPLKISFNSSFVIDAVRSLNCTDVTFLFVGEMKPFVVKNSNDDSVIQIVTPVRNFN